MIFRSSPTSRSNQTGIIDRNGDQEKPSGRDKTIEVDRTRHVEQTGALEVLRINGISDDESTAVIDALSRAASAAGEGAKIANYAMCEGECLCCATDGTLADNLASIADAESHLHHNRAVQTSVEICQVAAFVIYERMCPPGWNSEGAYHIAVVCSAARF